MNIHYFENLKRNLQFVIFIALSIMFLLSVGLHIKTLSHEKNITLIAIDSNGTRIVSDQYDPIYKTEATVFIKKFISNLYNFNPENFMQRVGLTTSLMSESLWKEKKSQIMDLKTKVERDEISLSSEILKLTKDSDGSYYALVSLTEKTRMHSRNHQIEIKLTLSPIERSEANPQGLEVSTYVETAIRN